MRVLNVGGGSRAIPIPDTYDGWTQHLLDIDPRSDAEIVTDARKLHLLTRIAGDYDAVYCSHNLEHYHLHDIPDVLKGFRNALNGTGFVHIRVPDLMAMIRMVADRNLDITDKLYDTPAGPVRALDMIYGMESMVASAGNDFMSHKTGFSPRSLGQLLLANGFEHIFIGTGYLEITAFAFKQRPTDEQIAACRLRYQDCDDAGDKAGARSPSAKHDPAVVAPLQGVPA